MIIAQPCSATTVHICATIDNGVNYNCYIKKEPKVLFLNTFVLLIHTFYLYHQLLVNHGIELCLVLMRSIAIMYIKLEKM